MMARSKVGILAVQGAFAEHEAVVRRLGADFKELRQASDLDDGIDRLILPGGESTSQGRILRDLGMLDRIRQLIESGMPVLGTCAGLILLAQSIDQINGDGSTVDEQHNSTWLKTLPVTVRRNAYGRQLGSFHTEAEFAGLGTIPMTFIRAPFITQVGDGVETLAEVDGEVVAVRYKNQLGTSFHPELDDDARIHQMLLSM
ncbi:5'-phosphate synthase pdxT subunit [Parafannyhessea umbonata]|uniref:Pyridoxal 5'-phosphate synthase subunit PdxT n=2 Tax=Parafannyhessea umbonata TaxID=604330 RepID=A0A1H9R4B3_9ACTN|nr:5'-phosphate synthase pdxT subunit [Parafannyhessea umbonata]